MAIWQLVTMDESERNETTNPIKIFPCVVASFLISIIVLQAVYICGLQNDTTSLKQELQDIREGWLLKSSQTSNSRCKRQIYQPLECPPGCIRKRKRKSPHTYSDPYAYYGQQGIQGPSGSRGAAREPGSPGLSGEPGLPGGMGARGEPGRPGRPGAPGAPGAPGGSGSMGNRGEPGSPGMPGARGNSGTRGSPGSPGVRGPPGNRGAPGPPGYSGYSYYGHEDVDRSYTRDVKRGDQGAPPEDPNFPLNTVPKRDAAQVLKELRLLDRPECKDDVDHDALMQTLKDKGKVSFMILVDLQQNVYCIVHA